MKTSELIGPALDWAVAKCEGISTSEFLALAACEMQWQYHYSTDWSQGGPIIEREKMWICENDDHESDQDVMWCLTTRDPVTKDKQGMHEQTDGLGPTILIAAMRCYVASKLGDEIKIPEELL